MYGFSRCKRRATTGFECVTVGTHYEKTAYTTKNRNGDTVQKACEAIADSGFILNFIEYNTAFQRCLRYTMQMQC